MGYSHLKSLLDFSAAKFSCFGTHFTSDLLTLYSDYHAFDRGHDAKVSFIMATGNFLKVTEME